MQAVESQTLILYHTDLRDEWPHSRARALAARLRYAKRLATAGTSAAARASLAGIALALAALGALRGAAVAPAALRFDPGHKPRLTGAVEACDFSIAHSGHWVGCAAVRGARVGLDIELGADEKTAAWVVREAALKAAGLGLAGLAQLQLIDGRARCGGETWHAHAVPVFAGAQACVMTDRAGAQLTTRAFALAELFA